MRRMSHNDLGDRCMSSRPTGPTVASGFGPLQTGGGLRRIRPALSASLPGDRQTGIVAIPFWAGFSD